MRGYLDLVMLGSKNKSCNDFWEVVENVEEWEKWEIWEICDLIDFQPFDKNEG